MKKLLKKVILVEDNPADVELTKIAYRSQALSAELVHCQNGEDLLQQLPGIELDEISYILLDLNMPKVGGIEVLKTFAKNNRWKMLPVIVFTSSSHAADVRACYESGANAYVLKPMDFNEFDRTLKAIHQFWGEVNIGPEF